MSASEKANRKMQPTAPAETGRQEGAPNIVTGRAGGPPSDTFGDGALDVNDPKMAADVTEIADQVHANA